MTDQLQLSAAQETLSQAPIGILLLDGQRNVLWFNQTLVDFLGLDDSSVLNSRSGEMPDELRAMLLDPPELILLQHGDEQRWLSSRSEVSDSGSTHFYLDVTETQRLKLERDKLAEDLQQLTTRDQITGLPNRRALLQGLDPLVSRSRRYGNPLSLIKLRVSAEGAPDAEAVWMRVGQLLMDQLRWADIIGRYDGADFLMILPETAYDAAVVLAEKIADKVCELEVDGLAVNCYCGVSAWDKGDDANLLLKRVDERVQAAKETGTTVIAA